MKRIVMIVLAFCMITSLAYSDAAIDLANYSYEELVSLQHRITVEIMSRQEWKEVEVPAGSWMVGEDIPAGTYSVRPREYSLTIWYQRENGVKNYYMVTEGDVVGKITFIEGTEIELSSPAIFAPPVTLGF